MSFLSQPVTLQSIFGTDRKIGEITMQVVINETTNDTLTITKQPVQQGASITDHAYKEPTVLSMTALSKDNSFLFGDPTDFKGKALAALYKKFLDLQDSRVPFTVITPKRIYRNMLISTLVLTTDKATENCLSLSFGFQEVIIVNVATVQVPRSQQKNPGATGATQKKGKQSAAVDLKEGIGAVFRR